LDLRSFSTIPNLTLAWKRIIAGSNISYKNTSRLIYESYQLAYKRNLLDLQSRIRNRVYQPSSPLRMYYPKPSGLQRPITLLAIEDQIVLQSIANIFAEKIRSSRVSLEGKAIFSNLLGDKGSIFFVKEWTEGYDTLHKKLRNSYITGDRWIASFDLSAFFDTISHDLIIKVIAPRKGSPELTEFVLRCLKKWSAVIPSTQISHGVPQGPIASFILAESIMLDIDKTMSSYKSYSRYVDDIVLMANSELEIRRIIVSLDKLCRDIGLIPRADKTRIKKITKISEIDDFVISLEKYYSSIIKKPLDEEYTKKLVVESLTLSRQRIEDKSKFRYAYFRAPRSNFLLRTALRLWSKHPEHTDVISFYLSKYQKSKPIADYCLKELRASPPYDYVCGEMWKHLARLGDVDQIKPMIEMAITTSKKSRTRPASSIGSLIFLCTGEKKGLGLYSKFAMWKDEALVQTQIGPYILPAKSTGKALVNKFLRRTSPDPGLSLTHSFLYWKTNPLSLIDNLDDTHPIVEITYENVGLVPSRVRPSPDPIKQIIAKRYQLPKWDNWHTLLSQGYPHAYLLLSFAEEYYNSHPTPWLAHQDAFNDLLFRKFIQFLDSRNAAGAMRTTDRNGHLIDYGCLLNNQQFTSVYGTLATNLRETHTRRNSLPTSHPFDKKTQTEAKVLKLREQKFILRKIIAAYKEIMDECDRIGI